MISVGDRIPEATFVVMTEDGPSERSSGDIFAGRKVILFGVPGAFTPTCHRNHLPGFIGQADSFAAKGVDEIAVVAANDVFVMDAWSEASKGKGRISFLADGSATFLKAIGMDLDMSARGMGLRSKRYAMLVDDGVVKILNVEDSPAEAKTSGADAMLAQI